MSKSKVLLLIIGLVILGAVVFAAAARLSASSPAGGEKAAACGTHAKASSSAGCTKTSGASASCPVASCPMATAGKGCPSSAAKTCGSKASKTANIENVTNREGETITLTGHYVCGRCDLGISDACQPGFQTKVGKNYLLTRNNLSNRLHERAKDRDVEIVTRVKKLDGVKYLEVEAVRDLS